MLVLVETSYSPGLLDPCACACAARATAQSANIIPIRILFIKSSLSRRGGKRVHRI
jgi:hypothetical protein